MPITTAQVFAGLRYADGSRWQGGTVTYSIPVAGAFWAGSSYAPGEEPTNADYGVLDAAQTAAFVQAIQAWDRLVALEIIPVADNSSVQGTIRVAFTDVNDYAGDDTAAYAYTPPPPGFSIAAFSGDIWLDEEYRAQIPVVGDFLYGTLLHEIGHALGLKHPFDDEPGTPDPDDTPLPAGFGDTRYTVMAYDDFEDSFLCTFRFDGSFLRASAVTIYPSTPMLLDIIAIQGIYGAGSANTGADTYTFDLGTADQPRAFMMTIYDTGGTDTIDLTTHTRASYVDLTPGAFSSIGFFSIQAQIDHWSALFPTFSRSFIASFLDDPTTYTWSNNVTIGPDTLIEIVRLGLGSDTLIGNTANNQVFAGAGSDSVSGGTGNDTIDGGAAGAPGNYIRGDGGDDSLFGGANFDDINGNMGSDTVSTGGGEDFCVGGQGSDLLFGGDAYDLVYGNLGDDTCHGEAGNDIVRGGQGNDTITGGDGADYVSGDRGDDTMTGGFGADDFHSFNEAGIDRVLDFNVAQGDRVRLDVGTTFTLMQVGGDTVLQMSGGQVVLVGIQMASLTPGSIFIG